MIPSPISPGQLIDLQRKAALDGMGEQARALLREGYPVDADRILDEMSARRKRWHQDA